MELNAKERKILITSLQYVKANWDHSDYYFRSIKALDALEQRLTSEPETIKTTLTEMGEGRGELDVTIDANGYQIWIGVEGYGEMFAVPGHATPIAVELYEGELRVMLWPDINEEEPLVVSMEGARESKRRPQYLDELPAIEPNKLELNRTDDRDEYWLDDEGPWSCEPD